MMACTHDDKDESPVEIEVTFLLLWRKSVFQQKQGMARPILKKEERRYSA
jgi:hypothetical protein